MTVIGIFFSPFIFSGKIPIAADTIVGMYHPFRDITWDGLISGVPFKNFLITDAVRQQYPWRNLAIEQIKHGSIPLWNSYSFSGTPLLANLQSAVFNPFNLLFFILPFQTGWGIQVLLQIILSSVFFYHWLKNLNLDKSACVLGALSFSFSGFFVAWLEWNTILQVALWLPLVLLAIDKKWNLVFILALSFGFFAGHLQTFFYVLLIAVAYFFARYRKINRLFLFNLFVVFLLTAIQSFPAFEFILNSARSFDQPPGFRLDWYLPWSHLAQFFAPDFFGNPTTLNYFGKWNYGEFVGYIGVIPLILSFISFFRKDRRTYFFISLFFISLLFALPNSISYLPYQLNIPFISTTAPSRLLFVTDFSLAILAALGFDYILKNKNIKPLIISGLILFVIYGVLFISTFLGWDTTDHLMVARRNLFLPFGIFIVGWVLLLLMCHREPSQTWRGDLLNRLLRRFTPRNDILLVILLLLVSFDLLRFNQKFNPFVKKEWIFPQTKILQYLQKQNKPFRIEALDSRILPPNFSSMYGLETIEGYDPLYSLRYGEFWAAVLRKNNNISPFNFNRIVTPQLYSNPFIDLLNVRYFLSMENIENKDAELVMVEGQTKLYGNKNVLPRVFLVDRFIYAGGKQEAINQMNINKNNLDKIAIVEEKINFPQTKVKLLSTINVSPDHNTVSVSVNKSALLIVSDAYYPGWKVKIDNKSAKILRVDYILKGVQVPAGKHLVEFYYIPKSFLIGLATTVLGIVFTILYSIWLRKK